MCFLRRFLFSSVFILLATLVFFHPQAYAETDEFILVFQEKVDTKLIEEVDGTIAEQFSLFPGAVVEGERDKILSLKGKPGVVSIESNREIQLETSSNRNWGIQHLGIPRAWDVGYTGKGVKVAVIDTGIADHPALRIAGGVSMVDYTTSYQDDNGHGTHSAGIIAGNLPGQNTLGVAHNVELYAVKSLDRQGNGRLSDTIRGIEWAIEKGVDLINLSLGTENHSFALKGVVDSAYEQGILVVAAAGNKKDNYSVEKPVDYPARYDSVIAVSAVDQQNRIAPFSATGNEIEFAAPGVRINSTYLNGSYKDVSGTSMAAPFVTGVLALYKEAYPHLSAEDIRTLAQEQAIDLGPQGRDRQFGYGLIQPPTEPITPPAAPEQVSGEVGQQQSNHTSFISLRWAQPANETVKEYRVYRNGALRGIVQEPRFHEYVRPGVHHYFITAVNRYGMESPKSKEFIVVVQEPKPTEPPEPADPPKEEEPKPERPEVSFTDIGDDFWAKQYVSFLAAERIIGGYEDGTFKPGANVTRGQAVAMIGRSLGWGEQASSTSFSDVDENHFASGYIAQAVELGVISGFPDGRFRPNAPITRAQMAAIIGNAFELRGHAPSVFTDVSPHTTGYREILYLADLGIVTGYADGTYKPSSHMTRAQFTVIMSRILDESLRTK